MKTLHSITIRGRARTWSFHVKADTAEVARLREDGLEVDEIVNSGPAWVAAWGLLPLWCFFQDLFHFRSPWR